MAPMPLPTALGFVIAGLGLYGLSRERRLIVVSGALLSLLSLPALLEFASGIPRSWLPQQISSGGTASNTALCFLAVGAGRVLPA